MTNRALAVTTVVLATAGALAAASPQTATSRQASAPGAAGFQWQRTTSDIQVTKSSIPGGTVLDLVDKSGDHVTVQLSFASKTITVSRNFVTRVVSDSQGLAGARALLDSSPAVEDLQKLANQQELDDTPNAELLRIERMVVGLLNGEADAVKRHADRVRARRGANTNGQSGGHIGAAVRDAGPAGSSTLPATPTETNPPFGPLKALRALAMMKGLVGTVSRARLVDTTPDACWAQYNATAAALVDTFVACRSNLPWYSVFDAWRCDFDYVFRAELAWAAFWACTGRSTGGQTTPEVQADGCSA